MSLIVQKFGGSSVGTPDKLQAAARRAVGQSQEGHQVVVVVSAMGDQTDELIALARQLHPEPDPREMDMLMAVGEQMSVALMAIAIHALDHGAVSLTGSQAGIRTDSVSSKAKIQTIDTSRIRQELEKDQIAIVAGFQGVDGEDNITTLGRGGSDTTAVALAAALMADRCDIFTDVDGIYTADPDIVPEAIRMDCVDYDEILELASMGARVMHSRAVEIAKRFSVPFRVRPSAGETEGTLVDELNKMEQVDVRGAALETGEAKITIRDVPDEPGVAAMIFGAISGENVNVDMIVQNVSAAGTTDLSYTVLSSDLSAARKISMQLAQELGAGEVEVDENVAKVSIVGMGMRSHSGVAEKMFESLARHKINIQMISTSEIKISVVISFEDGERALQAVHQAFKLGEKKR
ncbi:MAG: aspartate kinase [Candidatus Brocadiia bacterium]